MTRPSLGAYIRSIDFLGAQEEYADSNDNPGNKLIEFEELCNRDDEFHVLELRDGYGAFRDKVCIPNFPGRHSPPYWVAYSTACVLERLTQRKFPDDIQYSYEIAREKVNTWLALFSARPSSGQLDLMKKFTGDEFKHYIEMCPGTEMARILSKMKITVSYDTNDTDEEQTYAMFLNSEASYIFKVMTEDQYKDRTVQEALLDLHICFQQQLSKLSPTLANYVGYILRDIAAKFPDGNPYTGIADVKTLKSSISTISDSLATYEGNLNSLKDEDTLKNIMKTAFKYSLIKDIFPDLMDVLIRFSNRKTKIENGERIYQVYKRFLMRGFEEHKMVPDGALFDSCAATLECLLTSGGSIGSEKQELVCSSMSDFICKIKTLDPTQTKKLIGLFIEMMKSGRKQLGESVKRMLNMQEIKKVIVWKDNMEAAKQLLVVIGTMRVENMEQPGYYYDTLREQRDVVECLLEMFLRGKVLSLLQEDIATYLFNCVEIDSPHKYLLANKACDSKYLTISTKTKGLIDKILDKMYQLLKRKDIQWDNQVASIINNTLLSVKAAFAENGKNVTESQNAKIMSIFLICCEGESLEERMCPPELDDQMTPHFLIYTSFLPSYVALHVTSKTLACCIPAIKCALKMAKMAIAEGHERLISASLSVLQLSGIAVTKEMADIAPEVVELFLSIDNISNLSTVIRGIYPFNPEAIHAKLQNFIDKIEELSQVEKINMCSILSEIAGKHPEKFTKEQVGKLVDIATESDKTLQTVCLMTLRQIAAQCPKLLVSQFPRLIEDTNFIEDPTNHMLRITAIVFVGVSDEGSRNRAIDYLMNDSTLKDQANLANILSQTVRLLQNDREYIQKYKPKIEKLEKTTTAPEVKEACKNLIDVMEGKSLEGMFEDIQQAQDDIADLDKKVGATMTTVVSLGEHVIGQGKEISGLKSDVENLEVRVDEVEEDLVETNLKVEVIDNKTMTNAPKWSRDLTKLMNLTDKNDWRLLAKRLGYSNYDIKGWAQQNDPCMALLSEWYATHKTSEANFGLLTNLQEMNRLDGVSIVENAMKAVEGVVENEDFEYPSPPPIFLSYQWGVQNEVKLLKQHLNMAGYECWMDIGQMGGGDKLFNKIDQGVRAAKVIICCTTEKYAKSPNCNREVNLSVSLGKPIIPLLMEQMPWPPQGSMGPIFSEYLFIRFFQRSGEETSDQRYWPVAKFQELLMQLNFYVVPEPSLIQAEYSNWWKPITEEIKIEKKDKTKVNTPSSDKPKASDKVSPLVFLSYQWGKQPQVKALYDRLVSMGYSVWMDIFQMGGGDSLYDKIDRGMRGCKVVVSCVTPKYALSANCRREISLADALKKPLIPLLLEEMKWPPDGPMSMVFTELLFINMYRDPKIQETWTGNKVDEMVRKLQEFVPDVQPIGYASLETDKSNDNKETENPNSQPVAAVQPEVKSPEVPSQQAPKPAEKQITSNENGEKPKLETNNMTGKRTAIPKSDSRSTDNDTKSKSCILL